MDSMAYVEDYREFLEYFKAHVDPNDQLPVRVPGYNLLESEIDGEVINWVLQYLLQMKCPEALLAPIINETVQETQKSYTKIPKQCGFDGHAFNPLKLSTVVISHTNAICERLLDNAELNEMLTKSSSTVLTHTPRHCVKAIKNTRRKMEDRHVCISDFNGMFSTKDSEPTSFYGVFDGHGGQDAAFYTAAHICYNIAKSSKYPHKIDEAIRESFLKADDAFVDKYDKYALSCGTTALACLYRATEKRLFVGWVGDSQALLVCEGKVCQIVSPHSPSIESERERIQKMGGVVLSWNGSYRVNGQLAVSRAIGDAQFKPFITGEPDTATVSLEGTEDFLIIATDGLWESLTEDFIALFIYRMIAENPDCADSIADKLVEQARKGTSDNITIVVVFFKDPHLIAKSSWLNKMEAAYDKNNSNSAFENEPSHFKFSNMEDGFNMSPSMPVTEDIECQMMSPSNLAKILYNEANDVHITEESMDTVDNHQRFVDDFGPETDVDAMEETTSLKLSVEAQANENNNDFTVSNGIKALSLESKIMQQLSEQNRDILTDSNPFKTDNFEEYSDDQILNQTNKTSDDCPVEVVDNKIIDALESLAVSNGENEKHELEEGKQEEDLLDIRRQSPDIPDSTEKADYIHEKNLFMLDSNTKSEYTSNPHPEDFFNHAEHQTPPINEQENTPCLIDTKCVDESVGEDSEEEEDEWNYIQGDKKSEEKHNLSAFEPVAEIEKPQEVKSSESTIDVVNIDVAEESPEPKLLDIHSEDTQKEKDESIDANEKIDDTKDELLEITTDIAKTEEQELINPENQIPEEPVSIEKELEDYEYNGSTVATNKVAVSLETTDEAPTDEKFHLETSSTLLLDEISQSDVVRESSPTFENCAVNDQLEETVEKDNLFSDSVIIETPSSEIEAEHTSSMSIAVEDTPSTELLEVEEVPFEQQKSAEKDSDIVIEASVDEELERPDSLSLEMASKLNPEAKEFVPVSSPTRSNPTSPVANAPNTVPNSFLMLDDDTVVAQSPKKFTSTMDNIDVPAEDDFQHEMNNRPHELEKPSEYINGNADLSARSQSPASEPSYQELNLKEAMQADEKLEHDYNDEKQFKTEDSPSDIGDEQNILNVLNKEQDPMNMSFYEGRDDALLSNSDELNKVHVLPEEEDESEEQEQSNEDTDKDQMDLQECAPINQVASFENKTEIIEPNSTSHPPEEDFKQSFAHEEPSSAIYAVASQVVNDVAALVDQMQIESPIVDVMELQQLEDVNVDAPEAAPTAVTSDEIKSEECGDILVSLEQQNEIQPLEDHIEVTPDTESPSPNFTDNIRVTETEEIMSPLVESLQQEVIAENEFITDESVINVQSPSQSMFSTEVQPEPNLEVEIKDPITPDIINNMTIESVTECIDTSKTLNLLETDTPTVEQPETVLITDKIIEDLKPAVPATKPTTTKPAAKTSVISKSTASKTSTAKTAKPAPPAAEKKSTTPKATPVKPSTASKPPASTVKKTSTVSSVSSTRTSGGAKPPATSTVGRSSTSASTTTKLSTEKKAPLATKKSAVSPVNGETKLTPAARKPINSNATLKATTVAKSSTASSGSARPSSTTVRSTTVKASTTTTTKPISSAPAKSGTSTTTRTVSTVPIAKPRTAISTASKVSTSTTTSTTSTTSRTNASTITKRFSAAGTAVSKTTTTTTTGKTTASKSTNPAANRTSTVSKLSSTAPSGVRKTTTASPIKKSVPSSTAKTSLSSIKSPGSAKSTAVQHTNGKVSTEDTKTVLLDLDKQIKNDNIQLITNNGIDTQIMVIDSAAD